MRLAESPPAIWGPTISVPNLVTLVRTLVSVPLSLAAVVEQSGLLLILAYATYWAGDIADGAIARRRGEETKLGAVLDIVSDRACSALAVAALATLRPTLWPALALFLLQFMVLDMMLSLAFLRWPQVASPNYFYVIDDPIWQWNWSMPAKTFNTAGVALIVITGVLPIALLVAAVQTAIKLWTAHRLVHLLRGLA